MRTRLQIYQYLLNIRIDTPCKPKPYLNSGLLRNLAPTSPETYKKPLKMFRVTGPIAVRFEVLTVALWHTGALSIGRDLLTFRRSLLPTSL